LSTFIKKLEDLINSSSIENESNTPDFILARYLHNCLAAFTAATKDREEYYGVYLEPANDINERLDKLERLEEAGVDNWEGY